MQNQSTMEKVAGKKTGISKWALLSGNVLALLFVAVVMGITAVFFIGSGVVLLVNGLRSTSE